MSENEWPRSPYRKTNGGTEFVSDKYLCEQELRNAYETIARLTAALVVASEGTAALVKAVDDLIANSEGVYGLHSNGDSAPWASLTVGSQFGEWLSPLEDNRAAIAQIDAALKGG